MSALARRGPRPPYSPAGHDDHLYVDVETIAAVAEIGVRIHPRQFLDFMDRVCKEKGYPERIEDVPVMAALLEIREPVPLPPSWNAPWKLIDRPHLLQQLIDHGILLPDGVDQCLRSVADASHELGWEKMLDLAHRAVSLGASRANALLSSALEGDCVLMRLMLATKEDVKEAKDPEVVMHMVKSHRFTLEMCDLVIGAGYTVPGEAILVMVQKTYTRMDDNTRVAVLRRMLDAVEGDRAAFIAGPGLAIFTKVLFAAPRTVHGSLSPAVNEERVLEEVKALLDIGFRATASEIAMAKRGGLRETAALMEGFESAV
ncbi:hypothetical protein HK101_002428 [Irineochytrium annulatum]|nr:hypothetical protein HK101_002428 [Irineochytrium annulatum]